MTIQQLTDVLQASTVLGVSMIFLFGTVRSVRLDSLRQRLFALRDELFDFAADGFIAFDDPAYTLLRRDINAIIRYAHQLTLFRLLMTVLMRTTDGTVSNMDWNDAWEASLVRISDLEVREKMESFHLRATHNMLKHLVLGSPLLMLAVAVVMIGTAVGRASAAGALGFRQLAQTASRNVLIGPLDPRRLEENAVCDSAIVA